MSAPLPLVDDKKTIFIKSEPSALKRERIDATVTKTGKPLADPEQSDLYNSSQPVPSTHILRSAKMDYFDNEGRLYTQVEQDDPFLQEQAENISSTQILFYIRLERGMKEENYPEPLWPESGTEITLYTKSTNSQLKKKKRKTENTEKFVYHTKQTYYIDDSGTDLNNRSTTARKTSYMIATPIN